MGDGATRRWSGYYPLDWGGTRGHGLRFGCGPLGLGRRDGRGLRLSRRKPTPSYVPDDHNRDDSQYYFRVQKGEEFDLNRDLIKE